MKKKNGYTAVTVVLSAIGLICLVIFVCSAWRFIMAEIKIKNPTEHSAYAGYLSIPSHEIELPCIEAHVSNYALVELAIDKTDCGALIWYPYNPTSTDTALGEGEGRWVIGDHDYQGFDAIMSCETGDSVFLHQVDGKTREYMVVTTFQGYIEKGILRDKDGGQFMFNDEYDLILMTCYPKADVPANRKDRRFYVCLELVSE